MKLSNVFIATLVLLLVLKIGLTAFYGLYIVDGFNDSAIKSVATYLIYGSVIHPLVLSGLVFLIKCSFKSDDSIERCPFWSYAIALMVWSVAWIVCSIFLRPFVVYTTLNALETFVVLAWLLVKSKCEYTANKQYTVVDAQVERREVMAISHRPQTLAIKVDETQTLFLDPPPAYSEMS